MLQYQLIHPEILAALGTAGHGAQILIADGNYPFSTGTNPTAHRVFLNLAPDLMKVTDVLAVLMTAIPVETARVMLPDTGTEPPIFDEFRSLLYPNMELYGLSRH